MRTFPSPIGELHFSMKEKNLYERIKKVSVPYRGATFLNRRSPHTCSRHNVVSVPYRGATFLNNSLAPTKASLKCFRPLSGSYISQSMNNVMSLGIYCFRPLSGSYISQWYCSCDQINACLYRFRPLSGSYISQCFFCLFSLSEFALVSVPYRGATFLNSELRGCERVNAGFRPLSGSYISQYCICVLFQ